MRGAKIVFVDIRPDTMNIDEEKIESAITEHTKAIVVVHYAGVSCEMDKIINIAKSREIPVVEDAAQGVMSFYKGQALGTIGDLGCYSFHETKNYTMGEGGAILINNLKYLERAEIIREKGTNRTRFYRGEIDKYSWVDVGSSYLPSELNVSYLYGQLLEADAINQSRISLWKYYYERLEKFQKEGVIQLPIVPKGCIHNAHMFYIKFKTLDIRSRFIAYMQKQGIHCVFHYVPLHTSEAGRKFGVFVGEDIYTTKESERLVRLPIFYNMEIWESEQVINNVIAFLMQKEHV